ncbi:hypothetical protein GTY86_20370 [Streptomyces sp. SID5770]|uniref:hypothetical protein n=1 Tax=Streptomyces sp. SID5770 TaxID=2690308 RepID=UPI00136F80C8|nr:hypothetical protein [Streptomyces sp. SID5770]MZE53587.1 hypothetical protein [Streptomyces sp. SID5770]
MPPRQLFPGLRGLLVPRSAAAPAAPVPVETKDLLGSGGVYTSFSYAGVTNMGSR